MITTKRIRCLLYAGFVSSLAMSLPSMAGSPTREWLNQIRSSRFDYEVGYGVSTDPFGNVLITGGTDGLLGDSRFGRSDAFVSKYDSTGTLVWTEQLGTSASESSVAVSTDRFGNVYISGSTSGNLGGEHAGGGTDAFLGKYNGDGILLWVQQIGSDKYDYSRGLTVDNAGNTYITGVTLGSIDGVTQPVSDVDNSAFVSKFDPNGARLWTKQFGTPDSDAGIGISADGSGHVYVSGHTTGSLGGGKAGRFDSYVMKLDFNGEELWARQIGTRDNDYNTSVASDGSGNVYVTGYTEGDLEGPSAGDEDIYLTKYDDHGVLQWTRQFGTDGDDQGLSVATDGRGNAYVSGFTSGDLGATNAGSGDAFVSMFDSSGNLQWTEQFGTKEFDAAESAAVDSSGNVYLTGHTDGIFEPSFPDLFRSGLTDAFIVKFRNPIPEPSTFLLGLTSVLVLMNWRGQR